MSGIILYQSKYGATKQYADWLAEETGFKTVPTKKADIDDIIKYDTIVLGGAIYASGISGIGFLAKNIDKLANKKIIIFCDGASPYDESNIQLIKDRNMKDKLANIPLFYLRGAWPINEMSFVDKKMCLMLRKSLLKENRDELAVWEKALVDAGENEANWVDKENIKPILDEINK